MMSGAENKNNRVLYPQFTVGFAFIIIFPLLSLSWNFMGSYCM